MRLHVSIICAEQFFCPVDGQLLGFIDKLTTAVIAFCRITFSIFIGKLRTLCLQNARAGIVFRRNQLDMIFLALMFFFNSLEDFVIETGDCLRFIKHLFLLIEILVQDCGCMSKTCKSATLVPVAPVSSKSCEDFKAV